MATKDTNTKKTTQVGMHDIEADWIPEFSDMTMKQSQHISQDFLDNLKEDRIQSMGRREGDYMKVASIPIIVIDQWKREGFNIYEHSGEEIIARLQKQNLGAFMATDKKVI